MRALTIACLLTAISLAGAAENLLPGGDMESGLTKGWAFAVWSRQPSRGTLEWSADAHGGKQAARIIGQENAAGEAVRALTYSPPIPVREGLYRLRGWYKTVGGSLAQVHIPQYAEDFAARQFGTPAVDTLYRDLPRAAEWSQFEIDLNIKPGTTQVLVLLRATDIGEVFFDDLALERVEEPLQVRLYPAEYGRGNTVPVVRGAPSFFRLMLSGDKSRIKQAEVVLDLPAGIDDLGLIGPAQEVQREAQAYRRYHIPVPDQTLAALAPTVSHCNITVWVELGKMPDAGLMYYRPIVDGAELPEKQATVRALPPLPAGPRPRRFHNFYCWGLFGDVPEKLWPDVYAMARSMGVDHHFAYAAPTGWYKFLLEHLAADGGTLWANAPHVYEKGVYEKGAETRIIAEGKAFFSRDNGHYARLAPLVQGAFWDYEPLNAAANPCWDDPPTVAAFAKKEGLDPATLTEEKLRGDFRERFLAFRTWQLSEVLRLWAAYVHDVRPDLTIAICQGSGMPPDRNVDYRAYDDIPHLVHLPMIYTSSAFAFATNVRDLQAYLPGATLFPMTSTSMLADGGWLAAKTPRAIYFDCVTSALNGSIGCSHWPDLERGLDMEYVWETSRAYRDIACVEPFLFDGKPRTDLLVTPLPESEARVKTARGELRITSPQWDKSALTYAYGLKQDLLAAVCNMHADRPATVEVKFAQATGDGWYAYDPVTRMALAPDKGNTWNAAALRKGLRYEVPADELGMLVLSRQAPPGGLQGTVRMVEVQRRFAARCAETKAMGDIAGIKADGLEINWEDMDGDGNAEVRMASAEQELGLGPSGQVWSWRVKGGAADLVSRFAGTGVCADKFWWPAEARATTDTRAEYELVSREVKSGRAQVSFRRRLSGQGVAGLTLEKSYAIVPGEGSFEVTLSIRNESPVAHDISYWSHNCFAVGPRPHLEYPAEAGPYTASGEDQPREIWAALAGVPQTQRDLLNQELAPPLARPEFALGAAPGPRVTITTDPSLLQLYRWWDGTDQGRYTLEWMYQRQQLMTGQAWVTRWRVRGEG